MKDKLRALIEKFRADERAKKRFYIALTALALALSAAMIALMAAGERRESAKTLSPSAAPPQIITSSPDEGEELPLVVEIDDAQASTLLALALRSSLAPERVEARFSAPDELSISATVSREAVQSFLRAEGRDTVAALLALAPESLDLELAVGLSVGEGLELELRSFSACGIAASDYLPSSILDTAGDAISSALPDTSALKSVEVRDGSAVFTLGF